MIFLLLLAFFLERVFQCIWNIAAFRYCLLFSLLYLPTEQVYHSKQYSNFFCSRILDDLLVVFPLLISVHLYQCLHSFSVEYFFSASFFANVYRLLDFFFFFFLKWNLNLDEKVSVAKNAYGFWRSEYEHDPIQH